MEGWPQQEEQRLVGCLGFIVSPLVCRMCCRFSFLHTSSSSCTTKCSTYLHLPYHTVFVDIFWLLLVDSTHFCLVWGDTSNSGERRDQPSSTERRYTKCRECCKLRCLTSPLHHCCLGCYIILSTTRWCVMKCCKLRCWRKRTWWRVDHSKESRRSWLMTGIKEKQLV